MYPKWWMPLVEPFKYYLTVYVEGGNAFGNKK